MKKRILSVLTAFVITLTFIIPYAMPTYAMTTAPDPWADYENGMCYSIHDYMQTIECVPIDIFDFNDKGLTTAKRYNNTNSREGSFGGERGGSYGGSGPGYRGVTDYDTLTDAANDIAYSVVNNNVLNLSFDISVSFTEINYYPTYNVYNFVSNDTYYYVQNNVTYVTYMYYDAEDDTSYKNNVYYLLPDGRNSYDLTAEDVFGTYFIYDAINYDEVVEDDGVTLGLWHFDGDLKDSSVNANDITFVQNPSYSFVDSSFNSALTVYDGTVLKSDVSYNFVNNYTFEGKIKILPVSSDVDSCTFSLDGHTFAVKTSDSNTILNAYNFNYVSLSSAKSYIEELFGSGGAWEDITAYGVITHKYILPKSFTLVNNTFTPLIGEVNKGSLTFNQVQISYIESVASLNGVTLSFYNPVLDLSGSVLPKDYFYFSVVNNNGVCKYYFNGVESTVISNPFANGFSLSIANDTYYLDEFRLSNKALYTSDYVPRSQPFDTNLVLVLPEKAGNTDIAVKSNISVTDLRVGGVRPTFSSNGYVYVYLEDDIVKDVQQYQTDGWYSVEACIYDDNEWVTLKNYDLSSYVLDDDTASDGDSSSGDITDDNTGSGDNSGSTDGSGDSSTDGEDDENGILNKLVSTITDFIGNLFTSVFGGILDLVNVLIDNLNSLLDSFDGITGLIGSLFGFFPAEIVSVLTIGLSAVFILAIIKMFKG